MSFGKRLKKLRTENNLTQKQLAAKLNLALTTISGYERDERRPDLNTMARMSQLFGVTTDYLIGETKNTSSTFEEVEQNFPEGVKVLTRASKALTGDQKRKMAELMQWFVDSQE